MRPMANKRPCLLIILDGWGINPESKNNAVHSARTPVLDKLIATYPTTQLKCSGEAVGLPKGFMGNSEVGHMNIGAGRVVYQNLMRINRAIESGEFDENTALIDIMERVKSTDSTLHMMGLASDSGVHSHLNHLYALVRMAAARGLEKVCVHAITDGRDSPPDSARGYIQDLINRLKGTPARLATICGRYYAMDRDKRWDRTQLAFDLYTKGAGTPEMDSKAAIAAAYQRGETDEFIKPVVLVNDSGVPVGIIDDGDGVIVFNFRADRVRQITRSFTEIGFRGLSPGALRH